ncbi:hypothetical protein CDL15_Pgr023427 [Punica granatum]|uniref:Uncharacterized protein n=2 Tax=Punica granatum TaxID=22663 RepID=A0A218X580_PUNGR|nr:hypothetical protein CDL15_Pgr023427 [Punica granatum]
MFQPSDRDYTNWIQFLKEFTPTQFLWAARWNPSGPMTVGYPSVIGLPLISHLGSTIEVRRLWGTRIVKELYFPEHPTDEERAFSATAAYVAQFHQHGLTPTHRLHTPRIPHALQADIPDAESSIQGAMRTELQSIREERDRLRCELVDTRAELADYRELQSELAQTRARIANQDREIARLSATLDRARAKVRKVSHP